MTPIIAPLLLVLALQSQPPTPSPTVGSQSPQQQTAPKNQSPQSGNAPVVAPLAQNQPNQPNQSTANQNQQAASDWRDWFTGDRANWSIVALTFVLMVLAGLQWWASHTANKHTVVVERAYISIPEIAFANFAPDKVLGLHVEYRNTGHLPAHLISATSILYTEEPLPETPALPDWHEFKVAVPPGGSFTAHHHSFIENPKLSQEQYDRAIRGEFSLAIAGAIRYHDGFDRIRESGFAFVYQPQMDWKPIDRRFSFSDNPHYNYMK
jgi:hypothetical protein